MVLTIRSMYLRNTTSMGIAFVPLIKSEKWPIEKVQIRVSLLSATEVLSIMEELKQYTNFYSMVKNPPNVVVFKCHWFLPSRTRRTHEHVGLVEIRQDT